MSTTGSSLRSASTSLAALVFGLSVATGSAGAQERADTSRAVADSIGPRPELKPPISPRRAFLYSLALPGYSQSVLGRHRAGAIQLAFEAAALTMIRISAADVREVRRAQADSVAVSYVSGDGQPAIRYERTVFTSSLLRSRRSHVEDWIAVLMANHLFSAADGYVAALLWDLPAEVAVEATPRSAGLTLNFRW